MNSLDQILEKATHKQSRRIAVAAANDEHVLEALKKTFGLDIVEPVLIGDESEIIKISDRIGFSLENIKIIDIPDPQLACEKAVHEIREGNAEILMKGLVPTASLLKAVLNKENGLRKSPVLSHFALFQTSHYHKLIGITDAAMNISPDLSEKISIIENAAGIMRAIGLSTPKIAVLGPLETVNEKIPATLDAALLTQMNRRNQIKRCLIDGPLALDNAVSTEATRLKNIDSEVAGDADVLVAPDLNSGNILYKSLIFLSDGLSAAIITGARVPIVLTSRADSEKSKLYSIALAAAI